MESEVEEQGGRFDYQRSHFRRNFNTRMKRKGEEIFKETFGAEISFDEVEEEFDGIEAIEEIAATEVKKPSFPFFTMYIAVILDVLDLADFSGFGWVIMCIVEIIFTIILFVLMFRKLDTMFTTSSKFIFKSRRVGGKRLKSYARKGLNKFAIKYLKKYISRRLLATLIFNLIPVIGIFASNAFFVLLAHNKQNKIAQKYIVLVEKMGAVLKRYYKKKEER